MMGSLGGVLAPAHEGVGRVVDVAEVGSLRAALEPDEPISAVVCKWIGS